MPSCTVSRSLTTAWVSSAHLVATLAVMMTAERTDVDHDVAVGGGAIWSLVPNRCPWIVTIMPPTTAHRPMGTAFASSSIASQAAMPGGR